MFLLASSRRISVTSLAATISDWEATHRQWKANIPDVWNVIISFNTHGIELAD